jgi:hypothetical protein
MNCKHTYQTEKAMSKPRDTYTAGIRAANTTAWGEAKAVQRYGDVKYYMGRGAPLPKSTAAPQDKIDRRGPNYSNEVPVNSWLRGGGESGKPVRGRK